MFPFDDVTSQEGFYPNAWSSLVKKDIKRCRSVLRGIGPHNDHHSDVIMISMASQIPSASIVYLTVCSDIDQRKHQSSASLAFVRGIHRWPVNSPHKGPVTRKMFPIDDVIMWKFYLNIEPFRLRRVWNTRPSFRVATQGHINRLGVSQIACCVCMNEYMYLWVGCPPPGLSIIVTSLLTHD